MIDKKDKLEWVDSMRGLAICLVFLYHYYQKIAQPFDKQGILHWLFVSGNYGVQLFFIASAYTLMLSADRELNRNGRINWGNFFIRRFFRIAPAYYFAFIFFCFWAWFTSDSGQTPLISYISVLSFTNGFIPGSQNSIIPGSWSISAEYIFYFLFPIAFVLSFRDRNLLASLLILIPISIVGPKLIGNYFSSTNEGYNAGTIGYYHPLRWIGIFLIGIAVYRWLPKLNKAIPHLKHCLLAMLLIALPAMFLLKDLLPLAYFLFSIIWGILIAYFSLGGNLKLFSPLQFIGRLSFSAYLSHFWCLNISKEIALLLFIGGTASYNLFVLALAATLTTLISLAMHYYIEIPGQQLGKRITRYQTEKGLSASP